MELRHYLKNYNIFPSVPPSTDAHHLYTQQISTRVFIILLTVSLAILLLYSSLVTVTKAIEVPAPSFEQYSDLYSAHSQTLTCPCTKISINYDKFLHVNYTFHQVCNSVFVTQPWITYIVMSSVGPLFSDDFRATGGSTFQAVRMFCELTSRTISQNLDQFYSNQYVGESVTSEEVFENQAKVLIAQFKASTTNSFLLSLSTVRDMTQANSLLSGLFTNYLLETGNTSGHLWSFSTKYPNCTCRSSATCIGRSLISNYPDGQILFRMPDFYTGCFVIEALLQSTLQCFYDQSCIDELQTYLSTSSSINVIALDASASSVYSPMSAVEEIVTKLMIEEWNPSWKYDRYYHECQPTKCSFRITTRNDAIYIVTTVIGMVGGLITILKLVVPKGVKFIAYCAAKCRTRAVVEIAVIRM